MTNVLQGKKGGDEGVKLLTGAGGPKGAARTDGSANTKAAGGLDLESKGSGFAKKAASERFPRLPLLPGSFADVYPNQDEKKPFDLGDPHPLYPTLKRIDCELQ